MLNEPKMANPITKAQAKVPSDIATATRATEFAWDRIRITPFHIKALSRSRVFAPTRLHANRSFRLGWIRGNREPRASGGPCVFAGERGVILGQPSVQLQLPRTVLGRKFIAGVRDRP
jgi:hypothetical protein